MWGYDNFCGRVPEPYYTAGHVCLTNFALVYKSNYCLLTGCIVWRNPYGVYCLSIVSQLCAHIIFQTIKLIISRPSVSSGAFSCTSLLFILYFVFILLSNIPHWLQQLIGMSNFIHLMCRLWRKSSLGIACCITWFICSVKMTHRSNSRSPVNWCWCCNLYGILYAYMYCTSVFCGPLSYVLL